MSDMKCPFCGGELRGCIGHPYCRNEKCVMCDDPMPQELLDLLSDTKKQMVTKCNQLEIAVDALKWIDETYELGMGYEAAIREKCQFALGQIKEQQ